jgi:hypothetical protein
MKTCGENGIIDPAFLTSALYGGEWSASRPGRFTPGKNFPGTQWIKGSCICRESNHGHPDRSPSLYLGSCVLKIHQLICFAYKWQCTSFFLCVGLETFQVLAHKYTCLETFLTISKLSIFTTYWNCSRSEILMELLIDSLYLSGCYLPRQVNYRSNQ